jgi:hypothetical protein
MKRIGVLLVMFLLVCGPVAFADGRDGGPPETRGEDPPAPLDPPFLPDVLVSDDLTDNSQVEPHAVVDDLGYIHVGWIDKRSGVWRVHYTRSTDGGLSFEPSIEMVDFDYPETGDPVLAFENGVLYYAWISFDRVLDESDVAMSVSYDHGLTWGPRIKVSDSLSTVFTDKPWMVAKGDTVYVVYADIGAQYEVRFRKSTDQGFTWQPSVRINTDTIGWGNGACIDIGPNDEIYVSWWDSTPVDGGIFFSKSLDGGLTWSTNEQIAITSWWGNSPVRAAAITSLAAGTDGQIFITYTNLTLPDWNIEFIRSLDNGTTFSYPMVLNDDGTNEVQLMSWVDVGPLGTVHVAYYDNRTGQMEMRYTNSTNNGTSFMPSLKVSDVTFTPEWFIGDYSPLVADKWTDIHVIWCDVRQGNSDIYYSKLRGPGSPGVVPRPVPWASAKLEGISYQDVNITWTLSPDDGTGQNSVTNYSILYSAFYNGTGQGYMEIGRVPAGSNSYVASGMGHGDPLNYFFLIRANDIWGQSSDSTQQAGKFRRLLEPGWNLISPPLVQQDPSTLTVLQTVSYACVRNYDESVPDKWREMCPQKRYSWGSIPTTDIAAVLWVNVTQASNWTTAGRVLKQISYSLNEEWNLIGIPAFSGYNVGRLKAETGATRVEGFSSVEFPYRLKVMQDFELLQPGHGYWVNVPSAVFWTVVNL